MSGMKCMLDKARDDGLDAFNAGEARESCPFDTNTVQRVYWLEGWDYGADEEVRNRKPMTDEEIGCMLDYHFGAL